MAPPCSSSSTSKTGDEGWITSFHGRAPYYAKEVSPALVVIFVLLFLLSESALWYTACRDPGMLPRHIHAGLVEKIASYPEHTPVTTDNTFPGSAMAAAAPPPAHGDFSYNNSTAIDMPTDDANADAATTAMDPASTQPASTSQPPPMSNPPSPAPNSYPFAPYLPQLQQRDVAVRDVIFRIKYCGRGRRRESCFHRGGRYVSTIPSATLFPLLSL